MRATSSQPVAEAVVIANGFASRRVRPGRPIRMPAVLGGPCADWRTRGRTPSRGSGRRPPGQVTGRAERPVRYGPQWEAQAQLALAAAAFGAPVWPGDKILAGVLRNNAGVIRLRQGDLASARVHLLRAVDANASTGPFDALPLINLGWVLQRQGDAYGAAGWFQQAFRDSRRSGDTGGVAYAALGLACLASDAGEWRRSAALHGFADALMDRNGEPWQDPEDSYRQHSLDVVRPHLGDAALDQGRAEGHGLNLREAEKLAFDKPDVAGRPPRP